MRRFLLILSLSSLVGCAIPPQGDPIVDPIKNLAFVCEEYRTVLRDIRLMFRSGSISSDKVLLADSTRPYTLAVCNREITFDSGAEAIAAVTSTARGLIIMRMKPNAN